MGEEEFRNLLREELLRRCKENPSYSLRAFARFLQVDPSTLSQMLRHKRKISKKSMAKLGSRLGIGPRAQSETPTVNVARKVDFQSVSVDAFKVISDWYHFAITQYLRIPKAVKHEQAIALALSLSIHEVRDALERLKGLEMVTQNEDGSWKVLATEISTTSNNFTNNAFRTMQKQILEKASKAIDEVEYELRSQTSSCMPVDPKKIPEAKERIQRFRRELAAFLEDGDCTELYQMSISLFPLTRFYQTRSH